MGDRGLIKQLLRASGDPERIKWPPALASPRRRPGAALAPAPRAQQPITGFFKKATAAEAAKQAAKNLLFSFPTTLFSNRPTNRPLNRPPPGRAPQA